ncbi:MAG: hypothetical protein EOM78_22730 [Erysipelotrichia bacterium]|nr:hypothetical protein [Erysipelotrichia bacterium]
MNLVKISLLTITLSAFLPHHLLASQNDIYEPYASSSFYSYDSENQYEKQEQNLNESLTDVFNFNNKKILIETEISNVSLSSFLSKAENIVKNHKKHMCKPCRSKLETKHKVHIGYTCNLITRNFKRGKEIRNITTKVITKPTTIKLKSTLNCE